MHPGIAPARVRWDFLAIPSAGTLRYRCGSRLRTPAYEPWCPLVAMLPPRSTYFTPISRPLQAPFSSTHRTALFAGTLPKSDPGPAVGVASTAIGQAAESITPPSRVRCRGRNRAKVDPRPNRADSHRGPAPSAYNPLPHPADGGKAIRGPAGNRRHTRRRGSRPLAQRNVTQHTDH